MPGDLIWSARGQVGVGIVLSIRAGRSLLEWILHKTYSSAFRLDGSVRVNSSQLKCYCLLILFIYALTD